MAPKQHQQQKATKVDVATVTDTLPAAELATSIVQLYAGRPTTTHGGLTKKQVDLLSNKAKSLLREDKRKEDPTISAEALEAFMQATEQGWIKEGEAMHRTDGWAALGAVVVKKEEANDEGEGDGGVL